MQDSWSEAMKVEPVVADQEIMAGDPLGDVATTSDVASELLTHRLPVKEEPNFTPVVWCEAIKVEPVVADQEIMAVDPLGDVTTTSGDSELRTHQIPVKGEPNLTPDVWCETIEVEPVMADQEVMAGGPVDTTSMAMELLTRRISAKEEPNPTPGEKPYACDCCDYRASWLSHLNTHKLTHTSEKPYACDCCDYRTSRLIYLKRHKLTHTGEKPYACDRCDFRSSQRSYLKIHKLTHTGEKPYACDLCDYRASRLVYLKTHKISHTREKPFACDDCGYRATLFSSLKTHKLTHTGEKPYACDCCDYRASRLGDLRRHKLTHTDVWCEAIKVEPVVTEDPLGDVTTTSGASELLTHQLPVKEEPNLTPARAKTEEQRVTRGSHDCSSRHCRLEPENPEEHKTIKSEDCVEDTNLSARLPDPNNPVEHKMINSEDSVKDTNLSARLQEPYTPADEEMSDFDDSMNHTDLSACLPRPNNNVFEEMINSDNSVEDPTFSPYQPSVHSSELEYEAVSPEFDLQQDKATDTGLQPSPRGISSQVSTCVSQLVSPQHRDVSEHIAVRSERENIDASCDDNGEAVEYPVREENNNNKKRIRVADFCFFCEQDVLSFARHITRHHSMETEVAKVLSKPKKSLERKMLITALRKKGNYLVSSMSERAKPMNKGNSSKDTNEFLPCSTCLGLYSRTQLWRHRKKCSKGGSSGKCQGSAQNLLLAFNPLLDQQLRNKVFPTMRADNISRVAKSDNLICAFGSRYLKTHKDKRFVNVASRKMREVSRFLIEMKKIRPEINNLFSCFQPRFFDSIVQAVKNEAAFDVHSETFNSPTYAMNIATSLKQCCDIALLMLTKHQGNVLGASDMQESIAHIKTTNDLIASQWRYEVSTSASNNLNTKKWNKLTIIPLTGDLKTPL